MSGASFFDSNVLCYTDDADLPEKAERSLELWRRHRQDGTAVISGQVLQEYFAVVTRKMGVDPAIAIEKMLLFKRARVMQVSADDVISAARLSVEHRLSFWDALIVHVALEADCQVLYSEDLQADRRFASLRVVNPFV